MQPSLEDLGKVDEEVIAILDRTGKLEEFEGALVQAGRDVLQKGGALKDALEAVRSAARRILGGRGDSKHVPAPESKLRWKEADDRSDGKGVTYNFSPADEDHDCVPRDFYRPDDASDDE